MVCEALDQGVTNALRQYAFDTAEKNPNNGADAKINKVVYFTMLRVSAVYYKLR